MLRFEEKEKKKKVQLLDQDQTWWSISTQGNEESTNNLTFLTSTSCRIVNGQKYTCTNSTFDVR